MRLQRKRINNNISYRCFEMAGDTFVAPNIIGISFPSSVTGKERIRITINTDYLVTGLKQ
jgi:hypothetical protein